MIDMMIIFNLIYKDKYTGNWIYKRNTISLRYLSGWFWIDLFSVVPFFTVDWFIMTESWACDIHGQLDLNSSAGSRAAATVKMVKLLRMVKLTRVFKASRVLQRFAQDILMTKLEMSYAIIKVMYLIFALSFLAHWQACLWALVSIYMNGGDEGANVEDTWVTHFIATEAAKGKTVSPVDLYIAALYWSMMTLTSIGYGDMVPRNSTERLLSSFYMAISGVTWTYAIGQAAGIASTLDPSRIIYETTMDSLNFYMTERKLPKEMRITLRDYFQSARRVHQTNDDATLLSKMSPLLQGVVALAANKKWMDSVPMLAALGKTRSEREFVGELAKRLELSAYVANERIPLGRLYVLRCGMVVKLWRFMGAGRTWGEDFLLAPDFEMVDHAQAVALTFVETYSLSRRAFDSAAEFFVEPIEIIRSYMKRYRLKRALTNYLVIHKNGGSVKSYVSRSRAQGFDILPEILEFEKKVVGEKAAHASVKSSSRPSSPSLPMPTSPLAGDDDEQDDEEVARIYPAPFVAWTSGGKKSPSKNSPAKSSPGKITSMSSVRDELLALSKRLESQHAAQKKEITMLCTRLQEAVSNEADELAA